MSLVPPPDDRDAVERLWAAARPDDLRRIAELARRLFAASAVVIASEDGPRYRAGESEGEPAWDAPLVMDASAGGLAGRSIGVLRVFGERSWNDGDRATLDDLAACLCALIESRRSASLRGADGGADPVQAAPERTAPFRDRPAADGAEPIAPAGVAEASARILLADDLDLNRKLISDMLSLEGHAVHSVSDGEAAVRAAGEQDFDLILMDMIMPVMDGMAATRAIRALPAPACDVPIVALTAYSLPDQLDDCMQAGVDAVLIKPMSVAALNEAIAAWSGRRRAA